jgi:hypothetical protein
LVYRRSAESTLLKLCILAFVMVGALLEVAGASAGCRATAALQAAAPAAARRPAPDS